VRLKTIRTVPILIAAGVIGVVCLLQFLTCRYSSPAGEVRRAAVPGEKEPFYFDLVNKLEWMTYDWRVRQAGRHAGSAKDVAVNLGFVACGDASVWKMLDGMLDEDLRFGLLWPRQVFGRLIRELRAQGAKAIVVDVLLGELRPDHPRIRLGPNRSQGSDEFFADQMAAAGNVLLAASPDLVPPELFRTNAFDLGEVKAEKDADGILRRALAFRDYRLWQPVLERWARLFEMDLARAQLTARELTVPPARRSEATPAVVPRVGADKLDRLREIQDTNGVAAVVLRLDAEGKADLSPFYEALRAEGLPIEATHGARAMPFEVRRVWSMGIALAARELEANLAQATVDLPRGRIVLHGAKGDVAIPVERTGHFYIDWRLQTNDRRLTKYYLEKWLAQDILRQAGLTNGLENAYRDKLVVVGSTATGSNLTDLGATPLEKETPLMSKHWNVANSIITNRFIRRAPWWEELGLIVLLAAASAGLTWRLRVLWASFWVLAVVAAYTLLSLWLFVQHRYWLPVVLPVGGALLMTHVCTVTYRVVFEQAERRRVKSIFSKIVSPNVVNELLQQERLALGGARRHVTVLFADVRGFTQMTDENQKRAEEFVRQNKLTGAAAEVVYDESASETLAAVNLYLAAIADNVKKHAGTLDKYIGDCVMAFWGAPTPNEQHAATCVRAAIDSQRAMYQLNLQRAEENKQREQGNAARLAAGLPPRPPLALLTLGTGINTGAVIVGLMGSEEHIFNYTVFGRDVNLASRLEGVAGRGRIIISEGTYAELQRYASELAAACVPLPPTTVKGISQAVKIWEVPWKAAPADATAAAEPTAAPTAAPGAGAPGPGAAPAAPAPAAAPSAPADAIPPVEDTTAVLHRT